MYKSTINKVPYLTYKFRAEKFTIVVPPATNAWIKTLSQLTKRPIALLGPHHFTNSFSNIFNLFGTNCRVETNKIVPLTINRSTASEFKPQKVKFGIMIYSPASSIFTINDLSFDWMKLKTTSIKTLSKIRQ